MKYNILGNTGLKVSALSYGASPLGGVFGAIDEKEGIRTVHKALDLGVNLVDVSPYYGNTVAESVLGKAIKTAQRDSFILSSKAGRYGPDFADFDFSESRIRKSLEESLNRLNTDYLDIFLLHDIEFASLTQIFSESLPALHALKKEGKVRFVGVTGYPVRIFEETVKNDSNIDVVLTYCRYGLHDQTLLRCLPSLATKGIGVINASPTAMGVLTDNGAPDWHPASTAFLETARKARSLCQKKGVNITQLAMQYATGHSDIASTLVGTACPHKMGQNVDWINQPIDSALLDEVLSLFNTIDCTWPSGHTENQDKSHIEN